jgi:hypothetical protein
MKTGVLLQAFHAPTLIHSYFFRVTHHFSPETKPLTDTSDDESSSGDSVSLYEEESARVDPEAANADPDDEEEDGEPVPSNADPDDEEEDHDPVAANADPDNEPPASLSGSQVEEDDDEPTDSIAENHIAAVEPSDNEVLAPSKKTREEVFIDYNLSDIVARSKHGEVVPKIAKPKGTGGRDFNIRKHLGLTHNAKDKKLYKFLLVIVHFKFV